MAFSNGGDLSTGSKLSTILTDKPELIQQLALCLDREMRLIPNWKHLARKMFVDEDVIKRLEQHSDYSPTIRLFDHLEVTQPDMTIQTLRKALSEIGRNDICLLTTEAGCADGDNVLEIITSPNIQTPSPRVGLLDKMALALDATSLVLGNWYNLAMKLGVSRNDCWKLETRSTQSPTNQLFQYLETARPQMTLKRLKEALQSMTRNDLLEIIQKQNLEDDVLLKDVMTPGSQLLQTMADKLNRELPAVKNWKNLAFELEITVEVRREFADESTGEKRKSPTREVMEWVAARFPYTTLHDVVNALDMIERNDAVQMITKQVPDTVGLPSSPGGKPARLPCQTAHFIGREADVDKIINKLRTDPVRMIVLVSLPGMGKTEVAIRVSHLLKGRGDLSVIYVERQKKLTDICGEILDRLSSCRWSAGVDLVSLAKRKLSELQEDTVIVLDNTEDVQVQGKEFDEFAEWLVRSAPKAQLLITTREDVGFVSAGIHKVNLDPLDDESSAKLLQKLVTNCSEEHAKELGERCGGMPLFVINCSCLLNDDFSPDVLIQELRDNPIELLKTNVTGVYDALGMFITKFSEVVIRNLVLLSVFPSTFSAEDIQFLFEDQLQLQTAKTKMMKCALLQKGNDGKYSLHPLVQAYCRAERDSLNMVNVGRTAQHKFNKYYLELLQTLSKKFICKDSASDALSTFRKEKANISEAFRNCFEETTEKVDKLWAIDVANSTEVKDFLAKVLSPPKECTELYKKCCDISEAYAEKKRHADSLNSFGFRRLRDLEDLKGDQETLHIFQKAYKMREALPLEERESETHAHTISKLGRCYLLQGEDERGRKLIHEGINIRVKLGVSLYVAAGNVDLGRTYRHCGDFLKAIELWTTKTLPVYREKLGEHPWTASILYYIADSYKALANGNSGEYTDKAVRYVEEALKLQKSLMGVHRDTARSHVCLSDVLRIQGKWKLALKELEKGLEIQKDVFGPDHERTIATRNKMAELRKKMGSQEDTKERRNETEAPQAHIVIQQESAL